MLIKTGFKKNLLKMQAECKIRATSEMLISFYYNVNVILCLYGYVNVDIMLISLYGNVDIMLISLYGNRSAIVNCQD